MEPAVPGAPRVAAAAGWAAETTTAGVHILDDHGPENRIDQPTGANRREFDPQ
jgi:hypothetical protein